MTKAQIVERLAREQAIEKMCKKTAHLKTLTPDLQDLAQQVYVILLEYDEEKFVDLYERGALDYFIARIIVNQYRSTLSPFYFLFRRFAKMSCQLNPEEHDKDSQEELPAVPTRTPKPFERIKTHHKTRRR